MLEMEGTLLIAQQHRDDRVVLGYNRHYNIGQKCSHFVLNFILFESMLGNFDKSP